MGLEWPWYHDYPQNKEDVRENECKVKECEDASIEFEDSIYRLNLYTKKEGLLLRGGVYKGEIFYCKN